MKFRNSWLATYTIEAKLCHFLRSVSFSIFLLAPMDRRPVHPAAPDPCTVDAVPGTDAGVSTRLLLALSGLPVTARLRTDVRIVANVALLGLLLSIIIGG